MYKLAFVAAAAMAVSVPLSLTSNPADAAARVTVNPRYVPAVYCTYNSKDFKEKGIVSCPEPFAPTGFPGTRWKVSKNLTNCWNTNTPAGKDYSGWWAACPKPKR